MKIFLYYIGKPRSAHANGLADEYMARIARFTKSEMREVDPVRFDLVAKHPSATRILLDPAGKTLDSQQLAAVVEKAGMEGRDLVFAIGGTDGLPPAWKPQATMLLSLSAMTFPHELARAMLAEQIYRAFTILKGHPYPR
jgi:23S rRNA (pseudouridine1915-N3)-methyltransferase